MISARARVASIPGLMQSTCSDSDARVVAARCQRGRRPTRAEHLARRAFLALVLAFAVLPAGLAAQRVVQAGAISAAALPPTPALVPFAAGERLEYDVKFGFLHVGGGSMEVAGIDSIRGRRAWHTVFQVHGGTLFYKVNDRLESWIDVSSLISLRHWQELSEGRRERERRFEILPERGIVLEEGKPEA